MRPPLLLLVALAGAAFLRAGGPARAQGVPAAPSLRFEEVAGAAGLGHFRHVGGSTPDKRYIVEVMSGGVCAADFDGDGWTDLFFVGGGRFESLDGRAAPPPHALFRNRGDGTFEDVTAKSGLTNAGWAMGCVTADYDGDGRPDLYVTYYRTPNQLWRNRGAFAFEDVTARTGVGGPPGRWNTGATFGDMDGDGALDLFVAGYVALDPAHLLEPGANRYCRHQGLPVNCGPRGLPGEGDLLFRNDGHGRFTDVSAALGIDPQKHYGLGAVFLPLGDDTRPSLVVANDSTPNALYRPHDGGLREEGLASGIALSEEGTEQASMGIAWGDYDGDGRLDLYVTNFVDDYNTLYHALGGGTYEDATRRAQLAQPTWLFMGWGTAFADFDRDGRSDLVVANGHVYPQVDTLDVGSHYRMPPQVFLNRGDGTFAELPRAALPGDAVARGLAVADFWNDGRLGFAVNTLDGPPLLYRNRAEGGHALELSLEGAGLNRQAVGARVAARWDGGQALRVIATGGSYLSSSDTRVHFGLGGATRAALDVIWPGGRRQALGTLRADRRYTVREGMPAVEARRLGP
jgi:hypothetical protein